MAANNRIYDQHGFDARFDWGPDGAVELGSEAKVVIVVDVLSFSTAVDVAVSHGAQLYPSLADGGAAAALANRIAGIATVPRRLVNSANPFSLSPQTMNGASAGMKIVVASPNGARVALAAGKTPATVLAGCIRNAIAVAEAALRIGGPIAIIAAGERWRATGAIRPAFEDLVGAGAIIDALGSITMSPEARAALGAFHAVENNLPDAIATCASGRELIASGFPQDVEYAAARDVSRSVPVLRAGAFFAQP